MNKLRNIFTAIIILMGIKGTAQGIPVIPLTPPEMVCEKLYPGVIVLKKGDTLKGYIRWINRQANQRRLMYYKNNDSKTKAITIRSIGVKSYTINNQVYENVQPEKDKAFLDPDVLLYKVLDGGICLYQVYCDTIGLRFKQKNDSNFYDVCRKDSECSKILYAYKKGEKAANLSDGFAFGMNYKENMSKLVSENADLSKKVLEKEKGYRMIHRDKIILEYNEWYKQNKAQGK